MIIIDRRCDLPMKRSKEKGYTPNNTHWKCTGECKECICCIYKTSDGTEYHMNLNQKEQNG